MTTTGDIFQFIDGFAPFRTAMGFDNPGLLVGDEGMNVTKSILSLDITPEVVREASELGAQLIVSHHPVIFHPLKRLDTASVPYLLASRSIAAICAHTNLDMAPGGVNDCLAGRLRLKNVRMLCENSDSGLPEALCGETDREYSPREFAQFVKNALGCEGLCYVDGGRRVNSAGLCGGGGADYLYDAAQAGCQAFVTGECKHNILLDAESLGVTLVAAGHFETEDPVIPALMQKLAERFQDVSFVRSRAAHGPVHYL
ncbi:MULTISPECIES: Nif3-like dinuclear metal center hexameric protein [Acutalibacteraceae]|uniref:Nif3-like dinuclear metal center hexameric protein n=1 Tax=Acutalibacteraceae TaxID=3082771 RepID=UPI001FAA2404|nr:MULTISPECIES: Nif3-like dinuclear metal center hexameric protein [Acutalibacteraceae]